MRILVTGGSGQIGSALAARLEAYGTVIASNRALLDLARPGGLASRLDRIGPELIINCAAYTAVDKAEDEAELAWLVNGAAPGAIALWAAPRAVPLIHFSTDYVFDGSGERPWREDDRTGPLSIYGASKLAGEEAVRAGGGCFLIVRTSWVYAAKGTNFLRSIARAAKAREELRVVADQIGAPTSAALIADAVGGMLAAGKSDFVRAASEARLVHLAASGEASWHRFAAEIVSGLKARGVDLAAKQLVPIRTEDYPTRATRPRNSRLSLERLKTLFGLATPDWLAALAPELDDLAREMAASQPVSDPSRPLMV